MTEVSPRGPRLSLDSQSLRSTTIAASLAAPLSAGRNTICAGTFGLAFHALEQHAGAPVEIEGAADFAAAVRDTACRPEDLDEASYLARVVTGPEGLRLLARDAEKKLGDGAAPRLIPASLPDGALLVYACLYKDLAFSTPLARDDMGSLRFGDRPVACFGVWDTGDEPVWKSRAEQITVHDHESPEDFVIELHTRATEDRLILARIPRTATLGEAVKSALARAPQSLPFWKRTFGKPRLAPGEDLRIPLIDLELAHHFKEIEGRKVLPLDRPLDRAEQHIVLRLDERGALLRSEVALELPKGRARKLRTFLFNGPFLLLMTRKSAARPYLAAWIETPELLVPASRSL
ncbi:MAG: hypothetical protein R3B70_29040 [Polyangiaceae bacterium]